jgi:hypothetical protein
MARQIYRQEALERLSSPEQLDLLMPVTSARGWIALLGVGLLLAVGMVWAIFGTVATTVDGNGLLMRYGGLDWAVTEHGGRVQETLVREGDDVREGDVVALVSHADDEGGDAVVEKVRSPRDGRVLDLAAIPGAQLAAGARLVTIETPSHPLQAVLFVSANDGYKVVPDMPVKLLPATELDQGGAYLSGKVIRAARFPASQADIHYSLQNEEWVESFLARGPLLEVVVEIQSDKPPVHLYSGTPCKASITISTRRPIEFLIPVSSN